MAHDTVSEPSSISKERFYRAFTPIGLAAENNHCSARAPLVNFDGYVWSLLA